MTQPVNDRIKQTTATGGEPTMLYDFQVELKTDMVVTEEDLVNVVTPLVVDVDYVVNNLGVLGGGNITLDITKYPAGATLGHKFTMTGDTPSSRLSDFAQKGPFLSDTVNAEHDAFIQILQQLERDVARKFGVSLADGETPPQDIPSVALRKNLFAAYDNLGDPTVAAGTSANLGPVSAYIDTLLPAVDAAAARLVLDAAALTASNVFTKTQTWFQGADVGSAATLALGDGNLFDITGTVAITSIGTKGVGTIIALQFDGTLILTHNATNLVLPGGANITTATGDIAVLYEYATGDWRLLSYQRSDGAPLQTSIATTAEMVAAIAGNKLVTAANLTEAIELRAPILTTSGLSHDHLAIRASAKRITLMLDGVSTNGTQNPRFQLGTSGGGIEATGYLGTAGDLDATPAVNLRTAGIFLIDTTVAGSLLHGSCILTLMDAATNTWAWQSVMAQSNLARIGITGGIKPLSGILDRIRLTMDGVDTFDAGSFSIMIE